MRRRLTQLLLPPTLTPLARMLRGKTSEQTIHATGPVPVSLAMQDVGKINTPGISKIDDKNPHKNDSRPSGILVRIPFSAI